MIKPPERFCDQCEIDIPSGQVYATLTVPIPPSLRAKLVEHVSKDITERFKGSPLAGIITPDGMVPNVWEMEICTACIFDKFEKLGDIIRQQVMAALQRKVDAQNRQRRSLEDLDVEAH